QAPGQVPAVLDREPALLPERVSPSQELQVRLGGGRGRSLLSQLAAGLVDRHRRVRALVRIDSHDHHHRVPSSSKGKGTGRWAHLSGGEATLLSSHAGRFFMSERRQEAWCPRRTASEEPTPRTPASMTLTASVH